MTTKFLAAVAALFSCCVIRSPIRLCTASTPSAPSVVTPRARRAVFSADWPACRHRAPPKVPRMWFHLLGTLEGVGNKCSGLVLLNGSQVTHVCSLAGVTVTLWCQRGRTCRKLEYGHFVRHVHFVPSTGVCVQCS